MTTIASGPLQSPGGVMVAIPTCRRKNDESYLVDMLLSLSFDGALIDVGPVGWNWFISDDGPSTHSDVDLPWNLLVRSSAPRPDKDRPSSLIFPVHDNRDMRLPGHPKISDHAMGQRFNLWATMRRALTAPSWTRLLFLEDDIRFLGCNSLLRMATCPFLPDEGIITFHDIKELSSDSPDGLHHLSVLGRDRQGFWGLQAVAMRREAVEFLVEQEPWGQWVRDPVGAGDVFLGRYLHSSPWPFQSVHCPSLVTHIGRVSAAMPYETLETRMSKRPAGPDFDAGKLVGMTETRWNEEGELL